MIESTVMFSITHRLAQVLDTDPPAYAFEGETLWLAAVNAGTIRGREGEFSTVWFARRLAKALE
jgi:hypothetical protein